jgi:hypothetical protein
MSGPHEQHAALRGRRCISCGLIALALLVMPGCSGATAAGCGMGVVTGALIGALAAVSSENPEADVGTVMLGGSIFGIASGCSGAAVAESIGRADERNKRAGSAEPLPRSEGLPTSAKASQRSNDLLQKQTDLDGIKLYLLGLPRTDSRKVALRFERRTHNAMFDKCDELEIIIDGQSMRLPWRRSSKRDRARVVETVQVMIDIDTVKSLRSAQRVDFRLCSVERRATLATMSAVDDFVVRFRALVPEPSIAAGAGAPQAAPPPAPAVPYGDSAPPADGGLSEPTPPDASPSSAP